MNILKKRFLLSIFCIFIILIIGVYVLSLRNRNKKEQHAVLFSASQYAPYAYQIVPGTISKEVQSILENFELQQILFNDNSYEVKIRPRSVLGKNYQWKTFILKKGYRLYLAIMPDREGEFNDTTNLDYLNYDIPVLVDNNGYIAQ